MHYLIKMCSLCLCHNKDLIKMNTVQVKYLNFLTNVLLQSVDKDQMKLDEEYLCKMCVDKLESCYGLSELCIKNKMFSTFCCLCLNSDRNKLSNLRKSPECASFYFKLIKSVRPQILTCEKCLEKLNFYLRFQQNCLRTNKILTSYLQQLTFNSSDKIFKNTYVYVDVNKEVPEPEPEPEPETSDDDEEPITIKQEMEHHLEIEIDENVNTELIECKPEIEQPFMEPNPIFGHDDHEFDNESHEYDNESHEYYNENHDIEFGQHFLDGSGEISEPNDDNENELEEEVAEENLLVQEEAQPQEERVEENLLLKEAEVEPEVEEEKSCPFCQKKNIDVKAHKSAHIDRSKKRCKICSKRFQSISGLYKHINKHFRTGLKEIAFIPNDLGSPRLKNALLSNRPKVPVVKHEKPEKYERFMSGEKFVCKYCPDNKNIKSYATHKFKHIDREKNQCLICFKSIKYYRNLMPHLAKHFKNTYIKKKVIPTDFVCRYCPDFDPNEKFSQHKLKHIDPNQNLCLICFKRFESFQHLNLHIYTHFRKPQISIQVEKPEDLPNELPNIPIVKDLPPGERYACPFCPGKEYASLKEHKFHHIDRDRNVCLICHRKFAAYKYLYKHVMKHFNRAAQTQMNESHNVYNDVVMKFNNRNNENQYKQFNNSDVPQIENENDIESADQVFYCKFCNREVNETYDEHVFNTHINVINQACLICNKIFASMNNLQEHVQIHFDYINAQSIKVESEPVEVSVKVEDEESMMEDEPEELSLPLKVEVEEKLITCPYCAETTYNIIEHRLSHIDEPNRECLICYQQFDEDLPLYDHIDGHFSQFLKKSQRINHQKVALPKKLGPTVRYDHRNNQCLLCFKTFSTLYEVKNHVNQHVTIPKPIEKPQTKLICRLCNVQVDQSMIEKHKKSKQHINMVRFQNSEKTGKSFACLKCRRFFLNRKSYYQHINYDCKYVAPKFQCDICFIKIRRMNSLKTHMEKFHGLVFKK